MRITKHLAFFYQDDRIKYVNRIIEETNKYIYTTDLYIHTSIESDVLREKLIDLTNGDLHIIFHDLTNDEMFEQNRYYFMWKTRPLLAEQRNDYDIFIYIDGDMLVPKEAIEYWLEYKDRVMDVNYNLGFLRIEIDEEGNEYTTDNSTFLTPEGIWEQYLNKTVLLDNELFVLNDANTYCAFWIYSKNEFNRFVDSEYYDMNNIEGYGIPEKVGIGLHGLLTPWYNGTIIPLDNDKLHPSCRIYHLPNNYVHKPDSFTLHLFDEVVKLNYINNLITQVQPNEDCKSDNELINPEPEDNITKIVKEIEEIRNDIKEMGNDVKNLKRLFEEFVGLYRFE